MALMLWAHQSGVQTWDDLWRCCPLGTWRQQILRLSHLGRSVDGSALSEADRLTAPARLRYQEALAHGEAEVAGAGQRMRDALAALVARHRDELKHAGPWGPDAKVGRDRRYAEESACRTEGYAEIAAVRARFAAAAHAANERYSRDIREAIPHLAPPEWATSPVARGVCSDAP